MVCRLKCPVEYLKLFIFPLPGAIFFYILGDSVLSNSLILLFSSRWRQRFFTFVLLVLIKMVAVLLAFLLTGALLVEMVLSIVIAVAVLVTVLLLVAQPVSVKLLVAMLLSAVLVVVMLLAFLLLSVAATEETVIVNSCDCGGDC